ncbi:hypothetical protein [Methylomonas sp. AM2-LC]|uniref:hypothetical protein n=1 Tax=Methylomonas sp. AM2-LC TaxID=3153301 RepID=UPI003264ACE6
MKNIGSLKIPGSILISLITTTVVGCSAANQYKLKQHFEYSACAQQRQHDTYDPGGYAEAYEKCKNTVAISHMRQLGSEIAEYRNAVKKPKDPIKDNRCWNIGVEMYKRHLLLNGVKKENLQSVFDEKMFIDKPIDAIDTQHLIEIRNVMADNDSKIANFDNSKYARYQCNLDKMMTIEAGIGREIMRRIHTNE